MGNIKTSVAQTALTPDPKPWRIAEVRVLLLLAPLLLLCKSISESRILRRMSEWRRSRVSGLLHGLLRTRW